MVSLATVRNAGYLLSTDAPYSADPTGGSSDTAATTQAIQAMILDGCRNYQPTYLANQSNDAQGIYLINDTIRFYVYQSNNNTSYSETSGHSFLGATNAQGQRPILRVAPNTAKFEALTPSGYAVPVVAVRAFGGPYTVNPSSFPQTFDPYTAPSQYPQPASADVWDGQFLNFNIDCGGNSKACGMICNGAQTIYCANININATGAISGLGAAPGNGSSFMNLKVVGGEYGVDLVKQYALAWQSNHPTFAGLVCTGQTIACVTPGGTNGGETLVWGFDFEPAAGGVAVQTPSSDWTNLNHAIALYNGKVAGNAPTAFPNPGGWRLYLGDVYVSGFQHVTQFGTDAPQAAAGQWTHVKEYAATNQMNLAGTNPQIHSNNTNGSGPWPNVNFVNGAQNQSPEPVVNIQTSSSAPPDNLVSRHVVSIPTIDTVPFVDIRDHGAQPLAVPNGSLPGSPTHNYLIYTFWDSHDSTTTPDAAPALRAAIAAAPKGTAVLIPLGMWELASQVPFGPDTQFIALGRGRTRFATHQNWKPTTLNTPVFTMPNNPNTTLALTQCGLNLRRAGAYGPNGYQYDNFIWFDWQAGGECFTWGFYGDVNYVAQMQNATLITPALWYQYFHGPNCGGRFYGLTGAAIQGIAGNVNARPFMLNGCQQPMYFYSLNMESSKQTNVSCAFNLEADNCANLRILGVKREGSGNNAKLSGCSNVGFIGSCRLDGAPNGYTELAGCTNILLQDHEPFSDVIAGNYYLMANDTTGEKLARPRALSIYKSGELNDLAMVIGGGPTPPPIGGVTVEAVVSSDFTMTGTLQLTVKPAA